MSQKSITVLCEVKGSKKNLEVSGFKIISDSLIAFQPAIDDPSKKTPSFNISSSTIVESIVKCCNLPLGSVNLRSTHSASLSLRSEVGAIVKSLLFKTDNTFKLFLVAGDKKASLNKIKKILKIKDVCMASADEVKNTTGYTIGGVSPVGHLNKIDIFIDNSLERFRTLYAAAGHPNCVFKTNFLDLQKITKGSIKDVTQ